MVDRAVGEHALHVGLHDGEHRADDHREGGDGEHDRLPVDAVGAEGQVEDAEQAGEAGDLHAGGHPRHARARRPLVHVGGPEVERHRRDLEGEAHEQQREAGQHQAGVGEDGGGEEARDVDEVRGPGAAVGERDPVEEERGAERAQHEVLHAGFLRGDLAQVHGGEHVHGDGEDLEAEEHHDEVVGRRHHQAAGGRQHHEDVGLGALHLLAAQPAVQQQRAEDHRGGDGDRREDREPVDADGLAERGERARGPGPAPGPRGGPRRRSRRRPRSW